MQKNGYQGLEGEELLLTGILRSGEDEQFYRQLGSVDTS